MLLGEYSSSSNISLSLDIRPEPKPPLSSNVGTASAASGAAVPEVYTTDGDTVISAVSFDAPLSIVLLSIGAPSPESVFAVQLSVKPMFAVPLASMSRENVLSADVLSGAV